ncbi:4'-phosphopantetheinyl transferase [Rheinheimera sp.]|uniref:4'-phosphopantetheinyl transferase family protein n=1 Tax=Rheinheimera sp. TaxID=1869214 RepID=UPI0027B8F3D7|nr:4'-phosphopantetheinyl transferase superfamily protein [Rheinheimera sp.]
MNISPNTVFLLPQAYPCYSLSFAAHSFDDSSSFSRHQIELPQQLQHALTQRKADYLAGRICARQVLQHLGFVNFQLLPGADRAPLWPDGICGSISHSQHMAIAIAAPATEVVGLGIDIEQLMPQQQQAELQNSLIFPSEQAVFYALAQQQPHALSLVFSAKESIFKALFAQVGTIFGFDAVELIDFTEDKLFFRLTGTLSPTLCKATKLSVHFQQQAGAVLTFCVVLPG